MPKTPIRELPERVKQRLRPRGPRPDTAAAKDGDLPPPLQISAGLEPYTEPLDRQKAAHLLRRTSFGASVERLGELIGMPGNEAAALLVDEALAAPLPEPPAWAATYPPWDAPEDDQNKYFDLQFPWFEEYAVAWIERMYHVGLREKLTLFWHDHFATEWGVYFFSIMTYQYVSLLRGHALGNFRDFVFQMGLNPAMLVYLDGQSNTGVEPNENYARELLELFTMGQFDGQGNANYTQDDIVELSRALTGWYVDYGDFTARFDHFRVDAGEKEIFGQRARFDYGTVHTMIFEQRAQQIAEFIARKLYSEFVYVTPDEAVVAEMADLFLANDFEIEPVVRALLQSAHFFDERTIGAKIKSPAALFVGMLKETGERILAEDAFHRMHYSMFDLGQGLLEPPNVAGWPGYRSWVSTSTLPARWEEMDYYIEHGLVKYFINLMPLALQLVDPDDPMAMFKLPVLLAEHFLAVPASLLGQEADSLDFKGDLRGNPVPQEIMDGPAHVRNLAKILLGNAAWYEWSLRHGGRPFSLVQYFLYLTHLPEYQLT